MGEHLRYILSGRLGLAESCDWAPGRRVDYIIASEKVYLFPTLYNVYCSNCTGIIYGHSSARLVTIRIRGRELLCWGAALSDDSVSRCSPESMWWCYDDELLDSSRHLTRSVSLALLYKRSIAWSLSFRRLAIYLRFFFFTHIKYSAVYRVCAYACRCGVERSSYRGGGGMRAEQLGKGVRWIAVKRCEGRGWIILSICRHVGMSYKYTHT